MLTCRRRPVKSSCEMKNRRDLHPAMELRLIELESGLGGIPLRIPLELPRARFSHNNDIVEVPVPSLPVVKKSSAVVSLDILTHTRKSF